MRTPSEPIREKQAMLAGMSPRLTDDAWVFCVSDDAKAAENALATFREDEGLTLVLPLAVAREYGFDSALTMRRIELQVHSALDGVGLTAAVASALADMQIPCNMIAAFHHDHVFVPENLAEQALAVLQTVQHEASAANG